MSQQNQDASQEQLQQRLSQFISRRQTDKLEDSNSNNLIEGIQNGQKNQSKERAEFEARKDSKNNQDIINSKANQPEISEQNKKENQQQAIKKEEVANKNLLPIPRGEFSYITSASYLSIGDEGIQQKQLPLQDHIKKPNQEKFDSCHTPLKKSQNFNLENNEQQAQAEETDQNQTEKRNAKKKQIGDRLMQQGLRMKIEKEKKIKEKEDRFRSQSNPKIKRTSISNNQSERDKQGENNQIKAECVTDRLFSYHQYYKEKQQVKKSIIEMENAPSFTPKINKGFKTTSNIQKDENKKINFDQNLTFKPKIDKNSDKIATKLGKFTERLVSRKTFTPELQIHSYQPKINEKSKNLTKRDGNVFNNLYQKNLEIKNKLQEVKMMKAQKEKEQTEKECTFVPSLNKNSKYFKENKESISARNQAWQQNINEKIKLLAQEKAKNETEGCTFHPQIEKNHQTIPQQLNKEIMQVQTKQNVEKSYERFVQRQLEGRKQRQAIQSQKELRQSLNFKEIYPKNMSKDAVPLNESCEFKNVLQNLKKELYDMNLNI